jgi:hypothetical protein
VRGFLFYIDIEPLKGGLVKKNLFSSVLAVSFSAILFACAGHNNGPFPDHINLSNPTPAEQAMHAAEFRTMDSLAQIGLALAMQDELAWIASDSISADFPESRFTERPIPGLCKLPAMIL